MLYFILGYALGLYTVSMIPELLDKTNIPQYFDTFINETLSKYRKELEEDRSKFLSEITTNINEIKDKVSELNTKCEETCDTVCEETCDTVCEETCDTVSQRGGHRTRQRAGGWSA